MAWLAHGGVLALVVLAAALTAHTTPSASPALVVEHAANTSVVAVSPAPLTVEVAQPSPSEIEPAAAVHARTSFSSAVERWRPITRDTTNTVQRLTGVRLDEDLLLALVAVESQGRADALSHRGAVGLAQLEPTTFADVQKRYGQALHGSIQDPRTNLLAGALYLVDCARYLNVDPTSAGNLPLVLHAYSQGPAATAEWQRTGVADDLPKETVEHAARILSAYRAAHT